MADTKITALTAISTNPVNPATFPIPMVDLLDTSMAASGTTKKVTVNQILGSGGTATLASATITGDLTVDTSTLKVDSTNNRVGIGTASPSVPLEVAGAATITGNLTAAADSILGTGSKATDTLLDFKADTGTQRIYLDRGGRNLIFKDVTTNIENYRITGVTGVHTWGVGGTTAMTLNSTGLGVGIVPSGGAKLAIRDSGSNDSYFGLGANNDIYLSTGTSGVHYFRKGSAAASMTIDASGNLLVGATSAVASGSTFQNLGTARQVLTLKGNDATSYTLGLWSATTTGDNYFAYFGTEASTTVRGSVTYNRAGGLVAYNTTSDYRAKDIIGPVSNSGSLIDSLKVYVGKMKGATIERPMLIAHEVQEIAPYAVNGEKDSVDADGKPKYQQMDASALVPLLIAEIQSLRTRVQTLEAK